MSLLSGAVYRRLGLIVRLVLLGSLLMSSTSVAAPVAAEVSVPTTSPSVPTTTVTPTPAATIISKRARPQPAGAPVRPAQPTTCPVLSFGSNLVGNAGFESPAPSGGTSALSVGNWTGTLPTGNEILAQVTSPVHSGTLSAEVQSALSARAIVWFQDFPNFPAATSYQFSFWVWPGSGEQEAEFSTGWDRGSHGTVTGSVTFTFKPNSVSLDGWGQSATAPPLTSGQWHDVQVVADACTRILTVSIDGLPAMTTAPGTPSPSGVATLLVGQPTGSSPTDTLFYFDDVAVAVAVMAAVGWVTPPTPLDQTHFVVRLGGGAPLPFTMIAQDLGQGNLTIAHSLLPTGVTCINTANPGNPAQVDCAVAPTTSGFFPVVFDAVLADGTTAGTRTYIVGAGRYVIDSN